MREELLSDREHAVKNNKEVEAISRRLAEGEKDSVHSKYILRDRLEEYQVIRKEMI